MTDPIRAIKRQTLSRWLNKLIADGPEPHPALGGKKERERHERRLRALREKLDTMTND